MSRAARKAGLAVIVGYSESGPESLDTFIADLSVGIGAGQLMAGGLLTGSV
jgi:enolase